LNDCEAAQDGQMRSIRLAAWTFQLHAGGAAPLLSAVSGYGPERLRSLDVDSVFRYVLTKPADPKTIARYLQKSIAASRG
jgi:hypothetical protein